LTILNERQFDNGAGKRVNCPLKCVIGASNELPESEELDALLDRFLLRAQVNPVSDDGLLQLLSQLGSTLSPTKLEIAGDLAHLITDISASIDKVAMDQNICVLIQKLRTFVRDELNVYISDRRLVKASRLLRVCAATHGRSQVDLIDCLLLENILWEVPEQQAAIREWLLDNLTPSNEVIEQAKFLLSGLASEALMLVKKTSGDISGEYGARKDDIDAIKSVQNEIEQLENMLLRHSDSAERHAALVESLPEHLWFSQDAKYSAQQLLSPLALASSKAADNVLQEAAVLKLALTEFVENDLRSSVIEMLIDDDDDSGSKLFTEDELTMSMKEAKRKFDAITLKKWKSARRQ
jgi:MoxR-like ATPase